MFPVLAGGWRPTQACVSKFFEELLHKKRTAFFVSLTTGKVLVNEDSKRLLVFLGGGVYVYSISVHCFEGSFGRSSVPVWTLLVITELENFRAIDYHILRKIKEMRIDVRFY